ncbi:ABC transporter permease [Paenibacillus tarimensis]
MGGFLLKRVSSMIIAIWGMTLISFLLIRLMPVDPVEAYFAMNQLPVTDAAIEEIRAEQGLDRPLLVQYGTWVKKAVQLDFGQSFLTKKPVSKELFGRFSVTLSLTTAAFVLVVLISGIVGVWSVLKRNRLFDKFTRTAIFAIASMPSFWLAFIFIYIAALKWGMFPLMGWGTLDHMILPAITLALGYIPYYIRLIRTSMLEEMGKPHVVFARARGVKESIIIRKHIIKGTLPPLFTSLAMTYGGLLGGAAIIETVFTIPGIGRYIVNSIAARDYFVLQGFIIITGTLYIFLNFAADVLCAIVDPRARLKGDGI